MRSAFPHLPGRWEDTIVVWGNGPWDGHRLGGQSIARALAEHGPVLYVDPPRSLTAVGLAGVKSARSFLRQPRLSLVSRQLARLSPLGPPAQTRPGIRSVTSAWLARSVRSAVEALDGSVRAVISGYLYSQPFGHCGERARLLRVSDDLSVGAEIGVPVHYMARAQRERAAAADAVVCVSPTLVELWRRRGFDAVLIPNGCDADRLRQAGTLPVPADITLEPPIVGYVGLLANRIDFRLLHAIAERGHSLLLVGGVRPDFDPASVSDLVDRRNVQWIGHRGYDDLPAFLGAMAVGIVPYVDIPFNRASFPLKTLEYLAAGLPVVATDLPSIRWLDTELIRVATGERDFVSAVEAALYSADDAAERRRRFDFAAQHSWAHRAADYLQLLDRLDDRAGDWSAVGHFDGAD